jgi:hypothetical protein
MSFGDHQLIKNREHSHLLTHAHISYSMSISKRLSHLILRFIKSVTRSASLSTGTSPPTEKIISRKYNTHVKSDSSTTRNHSTVIRYLSR